MPTQSHYGLIGNGETAALIAPDLSLSWLCIPRFDGMPVFAAALDPGRGGALGLRLLAGGGSPGALRPQRQAYLGDTAVLETEATAGVWRLRCLDYMPWGRSCLVRELRVTNAGAAPASLCVQPVVEPIRSAAFPLSVEREAGVITVRAGQGALCLACAPVAGPEGVDLGLLAPGASAHLRLHLGYGPDPAAARAALAEAAASGADPERRLWERWLSPARMPRGDLPPAWIAAYRRSLVVLKLLSHAASGGLLAAPTASFPAVPGGGDNWDYRYVWLRDGYYTAMTLDAAGLHAEAARFYDFAFALQGEDGHWQRPLVTLDGRPPAELIAPDLSGPDGERPVRLGNAAADQLQLDNEGNLLHGLWFHYRTSGDRAALQRHWPAVQRACAWVAANWRRRESGIWEIREFTAHWVHGKAMCYAALTAGARIAAVLGHAVEAARWRDEAAAVRAEVVAQGWSAAQGAYLSHYGAGCPAPEADISVLALVFYGLLPVSDARVRSTVARLEREQADGGLALHGGICRYAHAALPFYLPTLWLARYYLMAGRLADCDRLLQTCLDSATDLGLMAEHFDGRTGAQWGNFPQAFSHEELARLILERGQGWSFCRWEEQEQPRPFRSSTSPPAGARTGPEA